MIQQYRTKILIYYLTDERREGFFLYTILINDDNTLTTSVRERIMQRSKLVDSLHFLCPPTYKELDMTDFTVTLEYILPVSREYKTEELVKSEE